VQTWLSSVGLVIAFSVAGASESAHAQSINQRKTVAKALIGGSNGRYDGSFAASGTSGVCGEIPKEASLTGTASFVIEFPSDGTGKEPINAIAFGSSQLVGGVTKATVFRLMITVVTAKGGRPPAYVLNTDSKNPRNTGTATLANKGGVTTLSVSGQNEVGETIELTVMCT
jgi:hypothetical protein